ncbi:hypothetical protein [Kineosporia succinea]|uniref:CHASE3 domain sensor protein n=1 Tax=Kineosporia succinea TaxID=84632 RepID=A0ABT9PF92_9ACTN|nr:hypothetical protein [Kineosporia succinea]MDP9831074.1 hypothetical protein [Kineosporia succinea]
MRFPRTVRLQLLTTLLVVTVVDLTVLGQFSLASQYRAQVRVTQLEELLTAGYEADLRIAHVWATGSTVASDRSVAVGPAPASAVQLARDALTAFDALARDHPGVDATALMPLRRELRVTAGTPTSFQLRSRSEALRRILSDLASELKDRSDAVAALSRSTVALFVLAGLAAIGLSTTCLTLLTVSTPRSPITPFRRPAVPTTKEPT